MAELQQNTIRYSTPIIKFPFKQIINIFVWSEYHLTSHSNFFFRCLFILKDISYYSSTVKIGNQWPSFASLVLLLWNSYLSHQKARALSFILNYKKKKGGKEKGGGVGRLKKSTCFESKKLPKTF